MDAVLVVPQCLQCRGTKLNLSFTKEADRVLRELAEDEQLQKVRLVSLAAAKVTALGLRKLRGAPALEQLDLSHTGVRDAALKHVAEHPELATLNLWATRVTSEGLSHLRELPKLRTLVLKETEVDDSGLRYLRKLPGLRSLYLNETQVTEKGVRRLQAAMPELAVCW